MPKQALKTLSKDLTFIRGSSRSAYNLETIEKSIQYFIKLISCIRDVENRPIYSDAKKIQLSQEQMNTINITITSLLMQTFNIGSKGKNQSDDN